MILYLGDSTDEALTLSFSVIKGICCELIICLLYFISFNDLELNKSLEGELDLDDLSSSCCSFPVLPYYSSSSFSLSRLLFSLLLTSRDVSRHTFKEVTCSIYPSGNYNFLLIDFNFFLCFSYLSLDGFLIVYLSKFNFLFKSFSYLSGEMISP